MQPLSAEERAQLKKQKADKKDKKRKITQLDLLTDAPPEAASRNQGTRDPAAEAEFMKSHEIVIHQQNAPPPCITLAAAPFHPLLLKLLLSQHFDQPSPIQAASWPVAAAGFDLLAIAKTGSGKTLGYLLPALTVCHENKKTARGPLALVMAPTRELAMQIQKEATKFGKLYSLHGYSTHCTVSSFAYSCGAVTAKCALYLSLSCQVRTVSVTILPSAHCICHHPAKCALYLSLSFQVRTVSVTLPALCTPHLALSHLHNANSRPGRKAAGMPCSGSVWWSAQVGTREVAEERCADENHCA